MCGTSETAIHYSLDERWADPQAKEWVDGTVLFDCCFFFLREI